MNSFMTKKTVVYTLAIIGSVVGVVYLFVGTLGTITPPAKDVSSKAQEVKTQRELKKDVLTNFAKEQQPMVKTVEFEGKIYTKEKKVFTEQEKIKILNNF